MPDAGGLPDAAIAPGRDGGRPWVTRPRTRVEAGRRPARRARRRRCGRGHGDRRGALRARRRRWAARWRVRRAGRLPAAGRPAVRRAPGPGGGRALRRAAALGGLGGAPTRRRSSCGWATCRRPSRCGRGWPPPTRCRWRSIPRRPGRTRPASVGTVVAADPRAVLDALAKRLARPTRGWLEDWRRADRAAAGAIASVVGPAGLNEPRVAAELGAGLPDDADARRRLLDAGARRGDVLPGAAASRSACCPTGARTASTARSPRRSASPRRHRRPDRAADRRRGAGARRRRAAGRLAHRREADDRADRQRRRRDLPLPAGGRRGAGVRRPRGHAARAGLRARRRAVRLRLGTGGRRGDLPRRAGPARWPPSARRSSACAPTARRTSSCTARVWESVRAAT